MSKMIVFCRILSNNLGFYSQIPYQGLKEHVSDVKLPKFRRTVKNKYGMLKLR